MDYDEYDIGMEPYCPSLKHTMRGKKDKRFEVLRCQGAPSLSVKCKSITINGNDSIQSMTED
jgi:hypothetical protein